MVTTPPNRPPLSPAVQGGGSVTHQPTRQDTPKRAASRAGSAAAVPHHPTDVDAATRRLDTLLAKDASGEPRKDVPRRGFYLNIVV